jgi:predicted phosphodiesterase
LKKVETTPDGLLICNTGSITFPKGGNPKTFAVYENGEVSLVELSEN